MFKQIKSAIKEVTDFYGVGISLTYQKFNKEINKLFIDREFFDDDFFDDFEETLIELDIVPNLAISIRSKLEEKIFQKRVNKNDFHKAILEVISSLIKFKEEEKLELEDGKLNIWLVIGVNGVGKTTTISKLMNKYKKKNIEVVAADTFRAGAIEQLSEWATRLNIPITKTHQGHAPSAVIYDGIDSALKNKRELLICDTAGRLHNKNDLMMELEKIHKIISKKTSDDVVLKTILVLDGTSGKNTISQAVAFNEITKIDGMIITKLDTNGHAGSIINCIYEIERPLYYLTTGESVEDIKPFKVDEYLNGMFGFE